MRFDLNPRTGMMEPRKDEQIYFAQSQGGGLRIDDHKNNIKYIIERDGRVTNLFGVRGADGLNIYDMRDARMIADRVLRMFGRSHKYADFHCFLRGYHMHENVIKTFDEFIDESLLGGVQKKVMAGEVRSEDGFVAGKLEDGTKLICPNDAREHGKQIEFDMGKVYYLEDINTYFVGFNDGDEDTYYKYDLDSEDEVNMVEWFSTSTELRRDDFGSLKAVISADNLDEIWDLDINFNGDYINFTIDRTEFMVFTDDTDCDNYAINSMVDSLESNCRFDKKEIENWRKYFGDDFLNEDDISDALRESYESYYDDMDEDDAIDELLRLEIIEDTEDYFELDEDGDPDHSQPKFDKDDYQSDYADKMMDEVFDVVDEYITNFGYDGMQDYVDTEKLARLILNNDGRGSELASYDGQERDEYIDDKDYYIFRTN